MLEYIAKKVKNQSDYIYNIVAVPGASEQLSVLPLDAQASAYPGALDHGYYYPWTGTQPAGGNFFDDLDNDIPETIIDHYAARAQARKADIQSIEARKVLNRNCSYVVGRGLFLKSTPNPKITGQTPEQAREWGKTASQLFHIWAKSKDSDVTGDNNFYQNQRFAQRLKKRDGEAVPRFNYSDDPELINPLQIGFIDSNQIRGDEFTLSSGPESQDVGIVFDKNGKKIAYKIWVTDPKTVGGYKYIQVPAKDKETGLPLMLLIYDKKNPGQTRGITELLPAISDLEKITGYKTAALDRMKNGASRDYVVENEQADPSNMDLPSLNAQSAGIVTKTDTLPTDIPDGVLPWSYSSIGGGQLTTGMVIDGGRQGDKLKASPDLSPGETSESFIGFTEESLDACLDMAPEIVNMKINTSFTAAKGAFGLQDIQARIERDDLQSDLIDQTFFAVISGFIASGDISAPGWSDPLIRAGYLEKRLTHDPPIILRPGEESVATMNNIIMGRENFDDAAERLNGSNFEHNANDNQKGAELLFSQIGTPKTEPEQDDEETDGGEDDDDKTSAVNDEEMIKLQWLD